MPDDKNATDNQGPGLPPPAPAPPSDSSIEYAATRLRWARRMAYNASRANSIAEAFLTVETECWDEIVRRCAVARRPLAPGVKPPSKPR